jgi:hypothetical protein
MINLPPIKWWEKHTFWQLGLSATGGTFLDWSINFLSGKSQNITIAEHQHQKSQIPENPIDRTNNNSHEHQRNHPANIGEIVWNASALYSIAPLDLHTFYFYHHSSSISDPAYLETSFRDVGDFFSRNSSIPHLTIYSDFKNAASFLYYRWLKSVKQVRTIDDLIRLDQPLVETGILDLEFFNKRELMALDLIQKTRGRQQLLDHQNRLAHDLSMSGLSIPLSSVFLDLDRVLVEMPKKFNNLIFYREKFDAWLDIYKEWQSINSEIHWFLKLPNLINDIVDKNENDISGMDEIMSCCLESELMTHGWSVKNQGLIKYPDSAARIEIEPCLHDINF